MLEQYLHIDIDWDLHNRIWSEVVGSADWLGKVILGEFADNRPRSAVVADALIGCMPGVGLALSLRDVIAISMRLINHPERRSDIWEWMGWIGSLIPLVFPAVAAAVGFAASGVGAVVGAMGGVELAGAIRALCLLLLRSGKVLLKPIVEFLRRFMKGDVVRFLKAVNLRVYESDLIRLVRWIGNGAINILRDMQARLKDMDWAVGTANLMRRLKAWEDCFYQWQNDAIRIIPQGLAGLQDLLRTALFDPFFPDTNLAWAGGGAKMPPVRPPKTKVKQPSMPGNPLHSVADGGSGTGGGVGAHGLGGHAGAESAGAGASVREHGRDPHAHDAGRPGASGQTPASNGERASGVNTGASRGGQGGGHGQGESGPSRQTTDAGARSGHMPPHAASEPGSAAAHSGGRGGVEATHGAPEPAGGGAEAGKPQFDENVHPERVELPNLKQLEVLTSEQFTELAFDADKAKFTTGAIEEIRALQAAQAEELLGGGTIARGARGADLEVAGSDISIKAFRDDSIVNNPKSLNKLVGTLDADKNMKLLIDRRSLTDEQVENISKALTENGIEPSRILVPSTESYKPIKVIDLNGGLLEY